MLNRLPLRARALRREAAGSSAIEFALILPIMLVLWGGMAEMARAISNWRRVTLLARTAADLTAKGDTSDPMATSTMSDILAASKAVLLPFPNTNAKVVVSAMGVYATSPLNPYVCSSAATSNAAARAAGRAADLLIPPGYNTIGNRYVFAEISMPYAPLLGGTLARLVSGLNGSITLRTSFAWPVRNGYVHNSATNVPEITLPGGAACP